MEDVKKLLEAMRTDPRAAEILKGKERPESFEDVIKIQAEIAKELGFALTEDEIREGIKALEEEQKSRTEKAKEASMELNMDDLNKVAGGWSPKGDHPECKDTYENGENCWVVDGCDIVIKKYSEYKCHIGGKH